MKDKVVYNKKVCKDYRVHLNRETQTLKNDHNNLFKLNRLVFKWATLLHQRTRFWSLRFLEHGNLVILRDRLEKCIRVVRYDGGHVEGGGGIINVFTNKRVL